MSIADAGSLTKWWTAEQLSLARDIFPDMGEFREDDGTYGPCGGAYGINLTERERATLAAIDWRAAGVEDPGSGLSHGRARRAGSVR
jgi:hypothetical protein